jgi:hypothetical protein
MQFVTSHAAPRPDAVHFFYRSHQRGSTHLKDISQLADLERVLPDYALLKMIWKIAEIDYA